MDTSKPVFQRRKPHATIAVIGGAGHGKTKLTAAITRVLHETMPELNHFPEGYTSLTEEDDPAGFGSSSQRVGYETAVRRYTHIDGPVDVGAASDRLDGAVLVVDVGNAAQATEHIALARQLKVTHLVVALNKSDTASSDEALEVAELEVRQALSDHDFDGDSTPVVQISALKVLENPGNETRQVQELMRAIDEHVPQPERDSDKEPAA